MKRAPRSLQHHVLYRKYNGQDSEISALLGKCGFKPDWAKHAKAAPFKRNDQMLGIMPIGVIIFPGTGIQNNLADKARKMGIPVYRFGTGSA